MNDERLLLEMRSWLQDEEVALPDPEEAGRQVAALLPRTRQRRRRWWRSSFLALGPKPPTIRDTTPDQPSPAPATNGHTASVTGRTQTMSSPATAIIAGALAFAIGGVTLIAQPFGSPPAAPGAEMPAEPEMTRVTMTFIPSSPVRSGETTTDNGVRQHLGACWTPELSAPSDPRFEGRLIYCADDHEFGLDLVRHLTYRIETDEGAWQGSTVSFLPGRVFAEAQTLLLVGEDGYEGLYAWLDVSDWRGGVSGAIFNFPPPEAPVPPTAE